MKHLRGMKKLTIYWSRRDFRLHDNPALTQAISHAKKNDSYFLPLYIVEPYMKKGIAYAQRLFLVKAIPEFFSHFQTSAVCAGKVTQIFSGLAKKYSLEIFVNEDIHPDFYSQIKKLQGGGVSITVLPDQMTISRDTKTGAGKIYSVFTPFKNTVWNEFISAPVLPTAPLGGVKYCEEKIPHTISLESLTSVFGKDMTFTVGKHEYALECAPDISEWYTNESSALKHFDAYVKKNLLGYKDNRDQLSVDGTSKMSLALAWGLVSARMLVARVRAHHDLRSEGVSHYISELIWREFYKYLFFHNPKLLNTEFQERFRGTIEWVPTALAHKRFGAWIKGETGYPVVDAAMKQIAKSGWMHNRARMIVASVLTKNLGVDWRWGQAYFQAVLLDLDEASNNGGWQWAASVGADPKPIRIFNPYLQAKNYDSDGAYQKKWLAADYVPVPLIEHSVARKEALVRYTMVGKVRNYK